VGTGAGREPAHGRHCSIGTNNRLLNNIRTPSSFEDDKIAFHTGRLGVVGLRGWGRGQIALICTLSPFHALVICFPTHPKLASFVDMVIDLRVATVSHNSLLLAHRLRSC